MKRDGESRKPRVSRVRGGCGRGGRGWVAPAIGVAEHTPRAMPPGAPAVLGRLPEQYFTRILAAAAAARARPGPRFIDLGRGNPDLPPPPGALEAVRDALGETETPAVHGYPPFDGQPALREAIARRYAADHGVTLDPEREV